MTKVFVFVFANTAVPLGYPDHVMAGYKRIYRLRKEGCRLASFFLSREGEEVNSWVDRESLGM